MIAIQTDIFGNQTITQHKAQPKQLGLFSATDTMAMGQGIYQPPLEEIIDKLMAAMIGKKYMTALGLSFATGLLPRDVELGLTTLKFSGRIAVTVTPKKIEEELYSLA